MPKQSTDVKKGPAHPPSKSLSKSTKSKRKSMHYDHVVDPRLFTLEVQLIDGLMTEKFMKENKKVWRTIQMRGDQTLDELHGAIFDAFGRDDPHMYEFQVGSNVPMGRSYQTYVMSEVFQDDSMMLRDLDFPPKDLSSTDIGMLDLKEKDVFFYWFDFGDDWWHKIIVKKIEDQVVELPEKEFPKLISQIGANPPQYVDWDAEGQNA